MIRLLRWIRRHLGLVAELAAYGFWLLVDVAAAASSGSPLTLVAALGVPLVVLLRLRPGARLVPVATAAVGLSIAFTLLSAAPVTALFGVVGPASTLAFTEQLALAVVVVSVLHRCPLRAALVLTAAAAVAVVGSPILRMSDTAGDQFGVLSALGWGGAVAFGLVLREVDTRRRAAVEDIRSAERMELARELHDVVAHHISMIAVQAETARLTTPDLPSLGAQRFSEIGDRARAGLTEMRRLLGVLRDGTDTADLRPQPGLAQLIELLDDARQSANARLIVSGAPMPLDPGVELAAYRIVQEALTNARRHAPGAAVDVEIRYGPELRVRIRDNGPGPDNSAGHGLAGMRERAAAVGGTLRTGPTPVGGFLVEAVLPVEMP